MGLSCNFRAAIVASGAWAIAFTIWHRAQSLATATEYFEAIQRDCIKNKSATFADCMDKAWSVRDSFIQSSWSETLLLVVVSLIGIWMIGLIIFGSYRWVKGGH